MLTRISSFHNYQSVQNDLRRQENKVHHNQEQLASGKKLLNLVTTPSLRITSKTLVSNKSSYNNILAL